MKIEVWSDYVCPFCYIGKRRLENALETTGFGSQTEVLFKAYQLDPNTPVDADGPEIDSLAKKFGSKEQAQSMLENITEQAKTVGLDYNIADMKNSNTFKAHRLAKLAEQEGVADQVVERLLHAHFVEGKVIGHDHVLLDIAEDFGINRSRAEAVLNADEFTDDVNADIAEAGQIGVQGVPFFVINRKYAISGAQPAEAFADALRKVAEEEGIKPKLNMLNEADGGVCTDGNCEV